MTLAAAFVFAAALAAASATPGPSTVALVTRVLAHGSRAAVLLALGLLLGELVWLAGAVFGVALLAQQFQTAFALIQYAGIAFLLYLAWRLWTAPVSSEAITTTPNDGPYPLLTGLAIALGNPKTMLFYVALLPCIVSLDSLSAYDLVLLASLALVVVGTVLAGYVVLAVRLRRFLRSPRALRRVNRSGAVLMAGAATVMATR